MRNVKVAATQMSCSSNIDENISKAETLVREAAAQGAQIILLQELFETPYFCQKEKADYYAYATELEHNKAINHFTAIAKELQVVLPISFYEKKNYARYNSLAVIDADGTILGKYRKSHIPDGPGYEEKFYFNPGDTGFKVWNTRYAKIGVGICWDQWYPEAARVMSLMGQRFCSIQPLSDQNRRMDRSTLRIIGRLVCLGMQRLTLFQSLPPTASVKKLMKILALISTALRSLRDRKAIKLLKQAETSKL